ncbi:MAG: hypothetical protein Q9218_004350 [Villophora microphyllina]
MLTTFRAVPPKTPNMKLPANEAALLVNVKIYMTRADETLSEKGIMMLSKITQLQNLLCRMARVTPESLERVLAGPLEIIKFDKERREIEAKEHREDAARKRAAGGIDSEDGYTPIKSTKKRKSTAGGRSSKTPTKINSGGTNYLADDDSDDMDSNMDAANASALVRDKPTDKQLPGATDTPAMKPKAGLASILESATTGQKGAHLRTPPNESKQQVSVLPPGFNQEIAIYSQDKDMMRHLTYEFKNIILPKCPRRVNPERLDDDIDELMLVCQKLNFDTLKYKIMEFAERRMKNPNKKAKIADLTDSTDPSAIFHAIQISAANETDARLHRIYCQIRLVASIEKRIRSGTDPKSKQRAPSMQPSCLPGYYLDELADQMCEGDSGDVRRKIRSRLRREHNAGRQWIKMFKELGGEGVALVFCFAEISNKAVVYTFTDFQRACISYVVKKLPSIQHLIAAIGSGTLESFCRLGHLNAGTMDRIKKCNGPEVIYIGSDDEDLSDLSDLSDLEDIDGGADDGLFMEVDG